jgi:flagellar biosynthesis protein FlhB
MAENEQGTQESTARNRERARESGQVPRSRDLSAAAVLFITALTLKYVAPYLGNQLQTLLAGGLSLPPPRMLGAHELVGALLSAGASGLLVCAPLWGVTLLVAIAAPLAVGGWNFSLQAVSFDPNRLNPVAGFGRMFSLRGGVELLKALLKFLLIATVAGAVLWQHAPLMATLGRLSPVQAVGAAAGLIGDTFLALTATAALLAAIDVPWQLWQYARRLRMTRTQVREEMRETEGSPEMKSRVRSIQRELARRRMMADVPKADVVVVNPTHYAVALRYVEARMRAPIVVAKGLDLVAARIREVAAEHRVPIFEAPPLARALHRHVEIGAEIPATLYVAVAQVLTYLAQLRQAIRLGQVAPPLPEISLEGVEA